MEEIAGSGDAALVGLGMRGALEGCVAAPRACFHFECFDADGNLKWTETVENVVTTQGKNDLLDKYLKGSTYTAAWFLLLAGVGTKAAADTLASHAAWAELTPYAGNRPALVWGTPSGGSVSATAIAFTINATATVAGAAVASVNTGTSGVLYNVADFAASRSVLSGDTLNVTMTLTIT
jgi:hypothetical protein